MDYNDNEEKTLNIVNTLNKGVWRGDSRTCEQGQVIYPGPVITRPVNMNEVDNQSQNDLNKPIKTADTKDLPTSTPVTIPNENISPQHNEEAKLSNNKSGTDNQPNKFSFTNSHPIRLSISSSSDSSDSSKTTTWGQVKGGSPKKAKTEGKKSPESSPTKNKNTKAMTSWKNISPSKSSSSSDLDNSSHSIQSNDYAPRMFRFSTSRTINDSTSSSEMEAGERGKRDDEYANLEHKVTNKEPETKCTCSPKAGSPCKKPGSCNCSNNCTSHLPDNQNALVNSNTSLNDNGSPKKEKGVNGSDDMCDNEYFYEDDFSVQFDTNLRETSVTPIDSDPSTTILDFPNMVSGSYLHFNNGGSSNVSFNNSKASSNVSLNNMRVSNIINNQEERVQYDSEFSGNSGSHNSTMEMSSSDRDMMGSSDIIDLSDGPLFTPTPTHLLTDSLDKNGRDVVDGEMSGSNGSGETNLNVDCNPRKEEYFLSFDGSQSRVSGSETDISLSMNSHESYPGHWVQSVQSEASVASHDSAQIHTSQGHDASNEFSSSEGQEESCDSFHMCFNKLSPRHKGNQYCGRENLSGRVLKKLVPLKETIIETGDSSEDENTRTSTTLTAGSKDVSSASPQTSPKKKMKLLGEQISQLKGRKSGQLYLVGIGKPEEILRKAGVHSHTLPKVKKLLSWKQLKNFKKGDYDKCASLPELNTSMTWQNISALKSRKLSEISQSFHGKRHSASLLEFYQRMKSQSNPVSPETMNNLEHILWPNFIGQKAKAEMSDSSGSSQECGQCQCGRHNIVDGLPDSGVKGYSNKRIYDWLKMDFSGSPRPNSLACQTGHLHDFSSKETLISPQTVTLWCGTKTVASQFPPATKDCSIQTFQNQQTMKETGILSGISKKDQALQTSDFEEEEILSILSDNFEEFNFLKSNEGTKELLSCPDLAFVDKDNSPKIHRSKSAEGYRSKTDKTSFCTNKSYQQRTSHFGRSKSTGRLGGKSESPVRRMGLSKHYSQQSLPDITFLSSSITIEKEESKDSLFDAMKLDLPVPVTIVPKTELEQFNIYKQTASPCHHKPQCCANKNKVKGSENEIGSSSSGISTSSASSGIDPGYCDCRSRSAESPQNDLERLIFYPPHTEEKIKSSKNCCGSKKRAKSLPSRLSECANPANPKIDKYANEARPQVVSKGQVQCRISEKWISAGKKQEIEGSENLYALEEEQTPVASPDQPCCNRNMCCGNNDQKSATSSDSGAKCNYFYGDQDFTESDFYRAVESDKIIVVGNEYYHGLALGMDSNSSSGSSAPNIDRKPLKSCLRKRNRGLRSRSMSATDTMTLNFDDLEEKVKNHRHSYGCDEVYIVSDEHGQLMMYQADDSAEPVMFYLGKDGECHMTEGHRNHMENFGSLANFNIQATDSIHESDSSTDREGNSKRKSVSFASEVSFQSISPAMSPKRQANSADGKTAETSAEKTAAVDGLEVTKDGAGDDGKKEDVKKEVNVDKEKKAADTTSSSNSAETTVTGENVSPNMLSNIETPGSSSSSDSPPQEFHVTMDTNDNLWFEDVMMEKIGLLMSVSKAADVLYAHFEKSKDTFDKLRLGNTSETPELGEIVLTRLCTALTAVLGDGLKHHLAGFQMFGSVQITVWKVVEASVEIVPQTRSLCDLVQKVKQTTYLTTHQQKFDAFIFGLLNLRVLDFWMGYLSQKEDQLSKFYNTGAILVHSNSALKKQYEDVIASIQKLAVLPFHMDMEFIKEKALTDSKFKAQEMIGSSDAIATTSVANQSTYSDSSVNQSSSKEVTNMLEITASKALSWLANAALPKRRTPSDSDLSESRSRSETIDTANQMEDSNSTSSQVSGSFSFTEDGEQEVEKPYKQILENLRENQQLIYKDARLSSLDCDPIILPSDSLRSSQNSQTGFVSLFTTMAARLGENTANQSLTQSMTSSASSLVTRLTGYQFGSQKTYKKGVTEYKFADGSEKENKTIEKEVNTDEKVKEIQEADEQKSEVKLREKNSESANENRNSKRVSFDIVNLFDKLLLPSAKPEKKDVKPASRIPRPTNRWSWSFGISKANPAPVTKLTKASTDSDIKEQPRKSVLKHESVLNKNEHFPKRNAKQTEKSVKSAKPIKNTASKVSGPPKPPRLVQSAPSPVKKSSSTSLDKNGQHSSKKNTATL